MIASSLDQLRVVSAALLQHLQKPRALVQLVALKAHQQRVGLFVIPLNQPQGLLGGWTEFTGHPEGRSELGEEWNAAFGREVVEAHGRQGAAASSVVGRQQVQLAAQAVAEPQRWGLIRVAPLAEGPPGFIGLGLMVKAGDIAPSVDGHAPARQGLE